MATLMPPEPPAIVCSMMNAPKPQGVEGQLIETMLEKLASHTAERPSLAIRQHTVYLQIDHGPPSDVPASFQAGMVQPMTADELAQAMRLFTRPEDTNPPLPFNPDDYPLF